MKICKVIRSLLLIIAGAELFANIPLAGLSGVQIAGLLLLISGLVKLAHACGMCSMCNSCCVEPNKKK